MNELSKKEKVSADAKAHRFNVIEKEANVLSEQVRKQLKDSAIQKKKAKIEVKAIPPTKIQDSRSNGKMRRQTFNVTSATIITTTGIHSASVDACILL